MEFTYGCEHELAGVDRKSELPDGMTWSNTEKDIVSEVFGAIDPTGKKHTIGGEINTPWSHTIEEQVHYMRKINRLFPEAKINHRHHTHLHIAWPGIGADLGMMKRILKYVQENVPYMVDQIFNPTKDSRMTSGSWAYQVVDRKILTDFRYQFAMEAQTTQEFFEAHAKSREGKTFYQFMQRMAINLYSIKKHGTLEMRCLFPTLDPDVLGSSLEFFRDFTIQAMSENPVHVKDMDLSKYSFPQELPYDHDLETLWYTTKGKEEN